MAMPMSASFERQHVVDAVAGHRHRVPAGLQGGDHRLFLLRGHPAEDRAVLQQAAERAGVLGQITRIDRPVGVGQAGPRRDRADGERAVPGDHLQRHALRREVRDGLGGVGSELLGEQDEGRRLQARRERLAVQRARGACQH
jgi:hypothetical protein